ncbi:MAG: polysaccharide deacetylase family protein [Spirochaetes bacterium]|nr:polysaccharide deacetylase family protein [Spirochaetota bacterium]
MKYTLAAILSAVIMSAAAQSVTAEAWQKRLPFPADASLHPVHVFIERTLYRRALCAVAPANALFISNEYAALDVRMKAAGMPDTPGLARCQKAAILLAQIPELADVRTEIVRYPDYTSDKDSCPLATNSMTRFYHRYAAERLRLFRLWPRVTSELKKVRPDEITGDGMPAKTILLTFDDGPSAHTPSLADLLASRRLPAMFFILGCTTYGNNAMLSRLHSNGFMLGVHAYSHSNLTDMKAEMATSELSRTAERITAATGKPARYFRAPYGLRNAAVLSTGDGLKLRHVLWNIDSKDWDKMLTDDDVIERVLRLSLLYDGGIMLYHDIHPRALRTLPRVIDYLTAEGYRFSGDCR